MLILFLILIVLALVILIANIAIVPQAYSYVVERLGVYYTTWEAGFHFKTPFVTRIAKKVSLKEQVVDFKPQPVITRDNVTMQIDTVVFFQITDPKLYTYGLERPLSDHGHSGRSHRQMGHQGEPRRSEKHHPAGRDSGRHGKADEGGTPAP